MHLSKPNVYQTLVLVGGINIDRYLRLIGFHPLFWLNRNCEIAGSTAFRLQDSRRAMNERQPIALYERKNSHSAADADLMVLAERELGAFIRAVTELFGPEQARLAAEDWVDELELMDALPGPTRRDWGSVTVAASAQLASRLNTDVDRPTPRVASTNTKASPIPSSNCFGPTGLA
jgi:hypothetical protein